jgi:hypothetical protein
VPSFHLTPRKVQTAQAQALYDNEKYTIDDICKTLRVSRV